METEVRGTKLVLGYIGLFLMTIGLIVLFPLIILPFYPAETNEAWYFGIPGLSAIGVGFLLFLFIKGKKKGRLQGVEDIALIIAVWLLAILVAAVPFMMTGKYSFSQAVFETTSGYTTTGLSVVDVANTSHLLLFHRSLTQLVGGVGLVLILTSAISEKSGLNLYLLEGHNDRLLPNLIKSARLIFAIYLLFVVLGSIALVLAGLSVFDAVNNAIGAVATGGFSPNPLSIAGYDSVAVEIIIEVLMFLGSTSFVIHYFFLRGQFKKACFHYEFAVSLSVFAILFPIIAVYMTQYYGGNVGLGLRHGFFEFVSAISGTGFQSVDSIVKLPSPVFFALILLMICGGQAGSTTGAIKQSRIGLFFLSIYWDIKAKIMKEETVTSHFVTRFGEKTLVSNEELHSAINFVALYVIVLFAGTIALCCCGYSLQDSLFEFASSLGTVGLGAGIASYSASPAVLWIEIIGMFLGRLEIVIIIMFIAKGIIGVRKNRNIYHCENVGKAQ